jgi:hypothetical protein
LAFVGGAVIGALGGLIGLGGAEFRLPLLIGALRFAALQAVILNKAMSLVVVASALPFRASAVPFSALAAHWSIIVNLLAGSLLGAWFGAGWATRIASQTLYRVIAILLLGIAVVLVFAHDTAASSAMLSGAPQMVAVLWPALQLASSRRCSASPAASCLFPRSSCCSARISNSPAACHWR